MIENVEAIVLSEDHYNALGVIRSLGLAKIPVNLILTTLNSTFCDKSKYVTSCLKVPHDDRSIIDAIEKITKKDGIKFFLFPLNDYAAQLVDSNESLFSEKIVSPNMGGKMYSLSNKATMKDWASRYDLLVPKGKEFDLNFPIDWTFFPAIIKPVISVDGLKSDIVTVSSLEELSEEIQLLKEKNYKRVLIEEYITGLDEHMVEIMGEIAHGGYCSFGKIISKIREFPIKNGSTAFAKVVDTHNGVDFCILEKMLRELEFVGLFDFEFKYADGKLYFIECNFRNGAPGWALTKIGYNLPQCWIYHMMGITDFQKKVLTKRNLFMCEQNDIINMLKRDVGLFRWIADYISSTKVLWKSNDLAPVLRYYILFIRERLKRHGVGRRINVK